MKSVLVSVLMAFGPTAVATDKTVTVYAITNGVVEDVVLECERGKLKVTVEGYVTHVSCITEYRV